jgi:hypothetical protein
MEEYRDENGELHREDGPACEYANGDKYWYWHGKLHRQDGPAAEYPNGSQILVLAWSTSSRRWSSYRMVLMVTKLGFIMDNKSIVNPTKSFSN